MLYQIRIFHCLEHEMGQIESVKSVFVVKIWLFYAIYRLWTTKFVLLFTFVHQIDEKYDGSMATNEQTHTHTLPNQVFGLTFWPKYQRSFAYALVWPFSIRNLRKIHFYSRAMRDWKMVINKLQLQTLLTTYIYHGRC